MKGWVTAAFLLGVIFGFLGGFVTGRPTFVLTIQGQPFVVAPEPEPEDYQPTGVIGMRG